MLAVRTGKVRHNPAAIRQPVEAVLGPTVLAIRITGSVMPLCLQKQKLTDTHFWQADTASRYLFLMLSIPALPTEKGQKDSTKGKCKECAVPSCVAFKTGECLPKQIH